LSEFRWDPFKCTWSITTNNRERDPREFIVDRQQVTLTTCPFCPGQESSTPPEVFAIRNPFSPANSPDWQVRVVPNKFPVLRIEGEIDRRSDGIYETMQGIGAHEVIIESPQHDQGLADLDEGHLTSVFQAYRERLVDLRRDKRFRYLQIFKYFGAEAGAPVPHSHSQLMAVPIIPPVIRTELSACRKFFRANQRCLACDLIARETADGRRVVYNDGQFIVVAPFASAFPFELRLFPLRHCHDFALLQNSELTGFAIALRDTLRRMRMLLNDPPYNFILHTAPPAHPDPDNPEDWISLPQDFHWHLDLVPRLGRIAGFEWGSGVYINNMPPENAARHLRNVDLAAGL